MRIGVIGAGSFGIALAITLDSKGHKVKLWGRGPLNMERYLPGISLPDTIEFTQEIEKAVPDAEILLFSVPAQAFRETLGRTKAYIDRNAIIVNVAKGIETHTHLRMSEVAEEVIPGSKYVALSGPSHAEEVAAFLPTTVAVASRDEELSKKIQEAFITDRFRVYTNHDLIGTELGGALKNIIALGAGISDGMGFGDNAKAAMMTRGITEMTRLGIAMGAERETFSGLTGIGDLIVTCTSVHSRNRRCGILMGQGMKPEEAVKEVGMVVEGMSTCEAAFELAAGYNVEMPITECIYHVIDGEILATEAVNMLMGREKKNELSI